MKKKAIIFSVTLILMLNAFGQEKEVKPLKTIPYDVFVRLELKIDSVYRYTFNEEIDSTLFEIQYYYYEGNLPVCTKTLQYDTLLQQWSPYSIDSTEYFSDGEIKEQYEYKWNKEGSDWTPIKHTLNRFVGDTLKTIEQDWNDNNGVWINKKRKEILLSENGGFELFKAEYYSNSAEEIWHGISKDVNDYTVDGKIKKSVSYDWSAENKKWYTKNIEYYDDNESDTLTFVYYYDSETDTFSGGYKSRISEFTDQGIVYKDRLVYELDSGSWELYSKGIALDGVGYIEQSQWSKDSVRWDSSLKSLIHKNEMNLIDTIIRYGYRQAKESWDTTSMFVFAYDNVGRLVHDEMLIFYDADEHQFGTGSLIIVEYEGDEIVVEERYQFKEHLQQWVGMSKYVKREKEHDWEYYMWDYSYNNWKGISKIKSFYDPTGVPTVIYGYSWKAADESWYLDKKAFVYSSGYDEITLVKQIREQEGTYVYPNPFNDRLTISGDAQISSIELLTLKGDVVYRNNNISGEYLIDTSNLDSGIYLIRVTDGQKVTTRKVIKR